mgnify:CR=1 FL=1
MLTICSASPTATPNFDASWGASKRARRSSDTTPSSRTASADGAAFAEAVGGHPVLVVHFWAVWDVYDRTMDAVLTKVAGEFGTEATVRSFEEALTRAGDSPYGLAATVLTAVAISDRLGRKRLFLWGLALFTVHPMQVAWSIVGAVALNLVLAMNHRPGRYLAAS